MPDPIDLDLSALDNTRAELSTVEARQTKINADLADSNDALAVLMREGASATALAKARDRVAKLERSQRELHDRREGLLGGVEEIGTGLVIGLDAILEV